MSTTQKTVWVIVIVIVVLGGYWWWSSSQSTSNSAAAPFQPTSSTNSTNTSQSGSPSTSGVPTQASITFNGSSFSPSTITIAQGGTVTFTSTAGPMWIASDPHPVHNGYDGTTQQQHCAPGYAGAAPFDQCSSGTSFSFTFNKVGTWGYHDHLDSGAGGTVTVVAQ